jgi:hypothetical protein
VTCSEEERTCCARTGCRLWLTGYIAPPYPLIDNTNRLTSNGQDPSYPHEKIDFYTEYIQRTAPICVNWFEPRRIGRTELEVAGANILFDRFTGIAESVFGALEDGSLCIWDAHRNSAVPGRMIARTSALPPLNQGRNADRIIEGCSVDSFLKRGYFATRNIVFEVDLATLSVLNKIPYTDQVCAISEVSPGKQLTVATNQGIQFLDTKLPPRQFKNCIHWCDSQSFTRLPDPSPLSILHQPDFPDAPNSSSIWIGGRFSHLLNYDTRMLSHINQTVHSGAHICSLSLLPNCYFTEKPVSLSKPSSLLPVGQIQASKAVSGHTILAAGNYRGRGSLELYGIPSSVANRSSGSAGLTKFSNRFNLGQMMSVVPHGGKIVCSDSNGMLKWVERDGLTPVRSYNINTMSSLATVELGQLMSTHAQMADQANAPARAWGDQGVSWGTQDLVQKIIPTRVSGDTYPAVDKRGPAEEDDLVIWTADGRLGLVNSGKDKWNWEQEPVNAELDMAEEAYSQRMRTVLLAHENELNWLPNLSYR